MKILKITKEDIILANRRAGRIIELEENPTGWRGVHKIFKSKKTYNRKLKHKNSVL